MLTEDTAMGELAQILFQYEDVRTVMLSATPYKMYTLHDEASVDNHYEDFLSTMDFLFNDDVTSQTVRQLLSEYRSSLFLYGESDDRQQLGQRLTQETLDYVNY